MTTVPIVHEKWLVHRVCKWGQVLHEGTVTLPKPNIVSFLLQNTSQIQGKTPLVLYLFVCHHSLQQALALV